MSESIPSRAAVPHLRSLTSLRFIAAVVVLVFHFFSLVPRSQAIGTDALPSGPIRDALVTYAPFLTEGHLAVDFFFVLSGFVLAHVYLDAWREGTFSLGTFLRKRFARLYPMHVVTLFAFIALAALTSMAGIGPRDASGYDPGTLPFHLTMTHSWGTIERLTFNGPSWSISAEWAAYLAFPLVIGVLVRVPALVALALACGWFVGLDAVWSTPGHPLTERSADLGVLRIAAEFPLGVALLLVSRTPWIAVRPVGWMAFNGGIAGAVSTAAYAGPSAVTVLCLASIIFGAAVLESCGGLKWLGNRVLVYGGEISYSMYMVHAFVQVVCTQVARKLGHSDGSLVFELLMLAGLLGSIVVSHFSYRWIEQPGQRLLMGARRKSEALPAVSCVARSIA